MWISAAVAIPLVIMTMGPPIGVPVREWIGERTAICIEFSLATPIVLWAANPFFLRGWNSIRTMNPNMWTLIPLGVAAAYLYSLVATFPPGIFPEAYRDGGSVATYYGGGSCHCHAGLCRPEAEFIAADGLRGHHTRTRALSAGNGVCDLQWKNKGVAAFPNA